MNIWRQFSNAQPIDIFCLQKRKVFEKKRFFITEAMNQGKFNQLHLWSEVSVEAGCPYSGNVSK